MGRAQRRQHEAAVDHVQDTFRVRSRVYRYLVVGEKVDSKGVMMLRCTFCNKVFQGTQFQATRHFSQTNYYKDVNDEALYEIARRTQQKFEVDQMERVVRYAAERGLDVPDTGGARGGEAGRCPVEGGVGGDCGHGAADPTLGGGGGETGEGVIHVDREARKGAATEGSSKRKEGGSATVATPAGKRLRQQKVTDVYGGKWVARQKKAFLRWLYSSEVSFNAFPNQAWKAYQQVLLEQSGSSPLAVLPNHCEIASTRAVETYLAELAEELEEVRKQFWVTGATLLSDGRKSRDGRPIVNFLAAGSRGVVVYTTINREGEADDAVHVLRRWVTIFHEFSFGGPQRINAICTDSASAYVGAARALASPSVPPALRRITWLPGADDDPHSYEAGFVHAPPSPVSPLEPATATTDREELGSSLPQRGLLHRGGAVRQLRLRSPSPGILQEEGAPSAAAVESLVAPAAVPDATIVATVEEIAAAAAGSVLEEMAASVLEEDPPVAGGGATVEGQVAAAGGTSGGAAVVEVEVAAAVEEEDAPSAAAVEEAIAAQAEVQRGGDDERLMQQIHGGA
ncbi:hypothetical protein CBR_g17749 [Chara braunii]|uniref:DUF659 domain-containing protein n=1 Tax=Chara braunii TaxID=69332 RepID=A0A388KVG0_CHABU|nr:hypothetical protein CBR_g17749 [Chara braunii]|eukprot:GBG74039.1 hypothetical protein CBR_g17749 [Chara braunii]